MNAQNMQVGGDHYLNMAIQPWSVIDTWPIDQQIGYYRGTALAYLMRAGSKEGNDLETEVRKAIHTLQKLIERIQAR